MGKTIFDEGPKMTERDYEKAGVTLLWRPDAAALLGVPLNEFAEFEKAKRLYPVCVCGVSKYQMTDVVICRLQMDIQALKEENALLRRLAKMNSSEEEK